MPLDTLRTDTLNWLELNSLQENQEPFTSEAGTMNANQKNQNNRELRILDQGEMSQIVGGRTIGGFSFNPKPGVLVLRNTIRIDG